MSDTSLLAAILRPASGSNLLDRASSHSSLSENQNLVDQMVSSSLNEATKGSTLLAMLGAGYVSRLTRAGVMSVAFGEGSKFLPILTRGGSYAVALANESAAFAGIERGFHPVPDGTGFHPSQTSFEKDWARAFINLGSLKLLGTAAEGQNLLLQHLLTDLGMVGGQQVGAEFGLVEKPKGNFAEQIVEAEALNWSQKGGMALLHGLSPGLLATQKSLDLYLKTQEANPSSQKVFSFFSRLATATTGGQGSPLQIEQKPLLMIKHFGAAGGGGGGGGGSGESGEKNLPSPLEIAPNKGLAVGAKPTLFLVTIIPDDSGSITSYGNAPAIRRGHNEQLEAYRGHPSILVKTRYLNGHVLFDYSKPDDAVRMDERNYNPQLETPLYNETFKALQEVEHSVALFADRFDVFAMSCIMTDGANTASGKEPHDVKQVVERMLASGRHIIAGIGVRDRSTDFYSVFRSMGIPEQWIKVLERVEGDIVQGMTQFAHATRSAVSPGTFMHASRTGFTGGAAGAIPQQPVVSPKATLGYPGQPIPGTALAGATSIGQMMGVPPEVPQAQPLGPLGLPWKPDMKKADQGEGVVWQPFGKGKIIAVKLDNTVKPSNPEWVWENTHWTYRMPADKDWTILGREGDTLLTDLRDPPQISRHHAGIRRFSDGSQSGYVIYALRGDVGLKRGDQPYYLQGNISYQGPGQEGESMWLLPGDQVMLGPDVSFIFRPQ